MENKCIGCGVVSVVGTNETCQRCERNRLREKILLGTATTSERTTFVAYCEAEARASRGNLHDVFGTQDEHSSLGSDLR